MGIGEDRFCAFSKCKKPFVSKTFNQKYCSDECCRVATAEKAMEKYYERKARRAGSKRVCSSKNCNTVLSRYNDLAQCASCIDKDRHATKVSLIRLIQ